MRDRTFVGERDAGEAKDHRLPESACCCAMDALMGIAGTLSIVGFTLDKLEVRLSNLMAFDGQVIGTWGCKPELYSDVVNLTAEGKLKLKPYTDTFPLSQINDIFQRTLEHKLLKRSIMVPDSEGG